MTFKEMTFQEKVDHIWEYYKLHIIGTVVMVLILGSIINSTLINPPAASIMDLTVRIESKYYNYDTQHTLEDSLTELLVDNPKDEAVIIELLEIGNDMDPNMVMASEAKFMGKAETHDLDLILVNEPSYEAMAAEGYFLDLKALCDQYGYSFSEEAFAYTKGENGSEEAYALDIRMLPELTDLVVDDTTGYYVALFLNSENVENAMMALAYMSH